jgi:hypothetical protein
MTFWTADWQTVAVAVIVLAALAYTARRALARLRSLVGPARGAASDCATGCGKCGDAEAGARPSAKSPAREPLVQIKPHSRANRR